MLPPTTLLQPEPSRPAPALPARDRFIDLLRVIAMALVVLQHWLMPVLALDDGRLRTGNAFAGEWVWPVTWIGQVMPLVFFAGGAAAAMSLRRRRSGSAWAARRLYRLAVPVLVLAVVWLPLTPLLTAAGLPDQPVHTAARYVGALLWFLALYCLLTALAPLLVRLAARARGVDVAVLAAGAVTVDLARFAAGLPDPLAYLNVLLVWGAVNQVGVHYAAGRLWWVRGSWALAVALGGFTVLGFAVGLGPYPASMVGMPGDPISNMGPPTAVLLALAAGQLGAALALRPAALRWTAQPAVRRVLDRLSGAVMTVYLWHTPALSLVAGIAVLGLGLATPQPFGALWYLSMPVWLVALTAVLAAAVAIFGRFERLVPPSVAAGPARLAVACLLVGGGLLGLTLTGFAPVTLLGALGPWLATSAVVAGLATLTGPTIDRWLPLRSRLTPSPGPPTDPAARAGQTGA